MTQNLLSAKMRRFEYTFTIRYPSSYYSIRHSGTIGEGIIERNLVQDGIADTTYFNGLHVADCVPLCDLDQNRGSVIKKKPRER